MLITGATGGIGEAICKMLVERGALLTAISSSTERLEGLAAKLGTAITPIVADLSDAASVETLSQGLTQMEAFDYVVLNAGVVMPAPLAEANTHDLDRQVSINLSSNLHIISAVLKRMIPANRGHIIATVSTGGLIALENYTAYSATKFGMRGALWSLHGEVKRHGIDVSGLYLSAIDTEMLHDEARDPNGSPLNFMGSITSPEKVAAKVLSVIKRPRLEAYLPYSDGLSARLAALKPSFVQRLLPAMNWLGERGRRKFVAKSGLEPEIDLRDEASTSSKTEVKL